GFELLEPADRLLDGAEVGQRAAQPALGHVWHAAALGLFLDRLARAALGAHEQHDAALLGDARDEVHRVVEQRNRLLEVDDVDLAAGAEDVRGHLRVPVARLVAEMDAGFQHLAHGDLWHVRETPDREPAPVDDGGRCGLHGQDAWFRGWASPPPPWPNLSRGTPARGIAAGVYSPASKTPCPAWAASRRTPAAQPGNDSPRLCPGQVRQARGDCRVAAGAGPGLARPVRARARRHLAAPGHCRPAPAPRDRCAAATARPAREAEWAIMAP